MLSIDPKAVRLLKAELHQSLSQCLCESPLQVLLQVLSHDFPVFQRIQKQIDTKNVDIFTVSPNWGEKGYWFLFPDVVVQFYVEDETSPENTHLIGSVMAEGDLNSRFSLSSLKETVAFGLLKYRMKMELKTFPQLFKKRNDSDLAGGEVFYL